MNTCSSNGYNTFSFEFGYQKMFLFYVLNLKMDDDIIDAVRNRSVLDRIASLNNSASYPREEMIGDSRFGKEI